MRQSTSEKYRNVGLAEDRYLEPGELSKRQEVAKHIRKIANYNKTKRPLKGWEKINKHSASLRRQAERYEFCGIEYTLTGCKDCGGVLVGRKRCETRICESCARKYAARVRKRYRKITSKLYPRKGKRLMFLTLTKRTNTAIPPMSSDARRILDLSKKLFKTLWPKNLGCGALGTLEVGGNNNLHVHMIVYGHYVPQEEISELWNQLTGDSSVVWINAIKKSSLAINYVLKYITKPPHSNNPKKLAKYLDLIIGLRRIRTWGILYRYPLASKDPCPCPFCGGKLKYLRSDHGRQIPIQALFFEEALKIENDKVN